MNKIFWIFLILFSCLLLVDIQLVVAQDDVSKSRYFDYSHSEGIAVQVEQSKKRIDKKDSRNLNSTPIFNSEKVLAKINSQKWSRSEKRGESFQKISIPQQSQVYLRFDHINLEKDEWIEIVDLVNFETNSIIDQSKTKSLVGPIRTEEVVIILHAKDPNITNRVRLGEIYIGAMDFGYDSSYECHKNIACDEGQNFSEMERGVVRIRMVLEEGIGFCTGSLVNNTSFDRTPYVLSAFHCQDGFTPFYDMWTFDFGYESFSCADPDNEPSFTRIEGCEMIAGYGDTDMLLLKLLDTLIPATNAYFTGWNRDPDYEPEGGVLIHHPRGDIKKISVDEDQITPFRSTLNWDNGITTSAGSHLVTQFDESTYQGGSSGGPLLDNNGYIIGQLHGGPDGDEFCMIGIGYHGSFAQSWEGGGTPETRLKDWLDPENTDSIQIEGMELNESGTSFISFVGRLVTPDGIAVPNVRVSIKGDKEEAFMTGSDGRFIFDNLPKTGSFILEFAKDQNHGNGVSAIDLVQIQNHILGTAPLFGTFQQRSADANGDGQVSSIDLVQILNVIIGRADRFPTNTSWRFEPLFIQVNPESNESLNRQIISYKIGDVNFSADPRR